MNLVYALYFAAGCCVNFTPMIRQTSYSTMHACLAAGETWVKTFPMPIRQSYNYLCWPEKQ